MLRKAATGILVVAISFMGCAFQSSLVSVRAPGSMIADANETLRLEVGQAMEQAADSLGYALDTRDLVMICRDDVILVNCGIAEFENVVSSTGLLQVDLGLIYVSREAEVRFGDGEHGKIPPGFYAVQATIGRSSAAHDPGITLLELFSSSGNSILEFPVTAQPPSEVRRLTVSLGVNTLSAVLSAQSSSTGQTEDAACLGWYGPELGCEMCLVFRPEE
ncbi:hypothetical protein ACFLSG_04600 [Candidatus Bipolaricaulota bacterium]